MCHCVVPAKDVVMGAEVANIARNFREQFEIAG